MTLALLTFVLLHPLGISIVVGLLAAISFFVVGAVSVPMTQFGALTPPGAGTLLALAASLYNTYASTVTAGTIAANIITGAGTCYLNSAATTPGTQTTRTATQLYQDLLQETGLATIPAGFTWELNITQTGSGTMTFAGGTGVTVTGTATIATGTTMDFVAQFTGTPTNPTFTFTRVATGTA